MLAIGQTEPLFMRYSFRMPLYYFSAEHGASVRDEDGEDFPMTGRPSRSPKRRRANWREMAAG